MKTLLKITMQHQAREEIWDQKIFLLLPPSMAGIKHRECHSRDTDSTWCHGSPSRATLCICSVPAALVQIVTSTVVNCHRPALMLPCCLPPLSEPWGCPIYPQDEHCPMDWEQQHLHATAQDTLGLRMCPLDYPGAMLMAFYFNYMEA